MSKIVQAINAMISNPEHITKVIIGEDDLFFLYKNKYKWSISIRHGEDYLLFFYPGGDSIEELSSRSVGDWEDTPLVVYKSSEIGTKEAKSSFAELFTTIKEKAYGVNAALDDIISDGF